MAERRPDVWIAQPRQALAGGLTGRDGGEALPDVAPMPFEMSHDQGLNGHAIVRVQVSPFLEVIGQGSRLVTGPGVERGNKLSLLDQTVLQGEQTKKEILIRGWRGHNA